MPTGNARTYKLMNQPAFHCRSHLAQAHIHQAGATAASALGQAIAGVPVYTWFFCGMIVLSRVAFWVYDMVDAQIFQTVSIACCLEHLLLQPPSFLVLQSAAPRESDRTWNVW